MDNLHEITGWPTQPRPHPGLAPSQLPGFYDLDPRNGAPLTAKENVHDTRPSGPVRAGPY
jgi:hypothetical protein